MIPRIIHYCWFGKKEKSVKVKEIISNWKLKLANYKIIEWNESNVDIENLPAFAREAFNNKKWAFVSDYVRLKALYDYGGIYLDTDVKIFKTFDDLLNNKVFIGFESQYSLCTAVIGAEKKSILIKRILNEYEKNNFEINGKLNLKPNSKFIFELLRQDYGDLKRDKINYLNDVTIYPSDYFSPINCYTYETNITENSYCIHYFFSSWKNHKQKFKDLFLVILTRIIGEEKREKLKTFIFKRFKNV